MESLPPENSRTGRSNSAEHFAQNNDTFGFESVEMGHPTGIRSQSPAGLRL